MYQFSIHEIKSFPLLLYQKVVYSKMFIPNDEWINQNKICSNSHMWKNNERINKINQSL